MDEYYTLTFFGYPDAGKYIVEDLQQFMCPEHYETIEDARLVAEYWMRYGFFRSVRCDKRAESLDGAHNSIEHGVFYAQKLDGKVAWRDWLKPASETLYTETTHEVVWKFESTLRGGR